MLLRIVLVFLLLTSGSAQAWVMCSGVTANLETSDSSGYHNFSELGVIGSTLFVQLEPTSCEGHGTDNQMEFAPTLFMVIDDVNNATQLDKIRISMLMSAEAAGKTFTFKSENKGTNSRNFQVLVPTFLRLD